jgi:trans-aconitate methyltransferase
MKIDQASTLLHTIGIEWTRPQSWCDLGCGKGTFTVALAQLLAPESTIHAVDLDQRALDEIPQRIHGVEIRKVLGDLQSPNLALPSVNGILMANSLHFIRNQHAFLDRLLSLTDTFLIVEYERSMPTPWGPYPVGFERLREIFKDVGVERLEKLATQPSRFGGTMYSALAKLSIAK